MKVVILWSSILKIKYILDCFERRQIFTTKYHSCALHVHQNRPVQACPQWPPS